MKATLFAIFGGALAVTLVCCLFGREAAVFAQRPGFDPSAELIALATSVDAGRQQLTVIDPRTRVMAVYQTELASGVVTLKSVRNISWDLQMIEFNSTAPYPREVRALLEAR